MSIVNFNCVNMLNLSKHVELVQTSLSQYNHPDQFVDQPTRWQHLLDLHYYLSMYIRGFAKFGIKVAWSLQFMGYLRTLRLKFQKARTKIEVVLSLPCWLSQLNWDSHQGRVRTTSILVRAFWNFNLKVLKYSRSCSLHNTLIPWSLKITWIT